jgi:hypothetical protein
VSARPPSLPEEFFAPLTWRPEELEQLRARVRELMGQGHPRSVASQAAFAELVSQRALERARTAAGLSPEPSDGA